MGHNTFIDYQKINNGVIVTASANTNCWYIRESNQNFSVNGSFSSLHTTFDWVLIKDYDSKFFKSGVVTLCKGKDSVVIKFKTMFKNSDYFLFFSSNNNVNLYWKDKKPNQFTVLSSGEIGSEISWLAVSKDFAYTTGTNNPGSIYAGKRIVNLSQQTNLITLNPNESLDIKNNNHINLNGWHNNEYIIKPTETLDGVFLPMNIKEGYSVLLSSNKNINTYWIEKAVDRAKIGVSYPIENTTIDYMFIKRGLNWWNEV